MLLVSVWIFLEIILSSNITSAPHFSFSSSYLCRLLLSWWMLMYHLSARQLHMDPLISGSLSSQIPPPADGVSVEPVIQVFRETGSGDTDQKIYSREVRPGETKGSIFRLLLCQSSAGQISLAVWFMETEEGSPSWRMCDLMVIVEVSRNALEFWGAGNESRYGCQRQKPLALNT